MRFFRLLLAAASVLALAACALFPKAADSPSTSSTPAAPPQTSAAPAAGQTDSPIIGPDGTIWLKSGEKSDLYQEDAENCFSFARARVDRDARVESDAGAAITDFSTGTGLRDLRRRMNNFERANRLPRLFGQCMEAKGYTRG